MNILDKNIAEIQSLLAAETDPEVFADLLDQEKKGKKRKVLKRWLRERIKSLKNPGVKPPDKRTDPITGIRYIG